MTLSAINKVSILPAYIVCVQGRLIIQGFLGMGVNLITLFAYKGIGGLSRKEVKGRARKAH